MKKAVFLDRDGVINKSLVVNGKPYAPRRFSKFKIFHDVEASLNQLDKLGFVLVIITNQPDIGNKKLKITELLLMHNYLMDNFPILEILYCPHSQLSNCECRKPKPGLFFQASRKYNIDLNKSFMIGDRSSDIEAGKLAGCRTIFIDRGYDESHSLQSDAIVGSLAEAIGIISSLDKAKG